MRAVAFSTSFALLASKASCLRNILPRSRYSFGSSRFGLSSSLSSTSDDVLSSQAQAETETLAAYFQKSSSIDTPQFWTSRQDVSEYMDRDIDSVLFDCDGVLYRTQDACPGARDCIQRLMEKSKKVLFVTNNAGVNRRQLKEKLSKVLQFDDNVLTLDQMVSSSYSCAQYLSQKLQPKSRVHVIGSTGLCEELEACGFVVSGGQTEPSSPSSMDRQELADFDFDRLLPIDAIAVGHDTSMDFRKLSIANNLLLRSPNALFVATNKDSFDIVGDDGRHIPGNGCTVVALEYCSRRTSVNVGKPSKTLATILFEEHNLDASRSLFVGDRLDTDIRFAKDNGMKSLLVMSGVTTAQTVMTLPRNGTTEEPLPDFVAATVNVMT